MILAAAGERDLAGVAAQVRAALGEHGHELAIALIERHEHRGVRLAGGIHGRGGLGREQQLRKPGGVGHRPIIGPVDDLALFAHALDGTRAFGRLVGLSRGSEVHELEGVTATLVPRCPERSVVNSVSYDDADALAAVLDELAGIYAAAGVSRWTVWVPQQDRGAAELLERAGHVLDAEPAAMGLDLGSLPDLPAEPPGGSARRTQRRSGRSTTRPTGTRGPSRAPWTACRQARSTSGWPTTKAGPSRA